MKRLTLFIGNVVNFLFFSTYQIFSVVLLLTYLNHIIKKDFLSILVLLATISLVRSQRYTNEERGMPISLFRFDPATLGIYNHAQANRNFYNRKKYKSSLRFSHGAKKGVVKSNDKDRNVQLFLNSTGISLGNSSKLNETAKHLLSTNPSPNQHDAEEHLDNVKFDSTLKSNEGLIKANNLTLLNDSVAINNQTDLKPTKELLFYRNKTITPSEYAEKTNSIKLSKTTPPEKNTTVQILKVYNTNETKNASLLTNRNETMHNINVEALKNDSQTLPLESNGRISSEKSNFNKNTSTVLNVTQKREEIIAQYIPFANISLTDHAEGFQAGSRKHKLHQMFPECYHCAKNSNYTDCVMKSKLLKCDKGLNNICFARSYKKKKEKHVTYEMGCINHRQCLRARPFPCRGEFYFLLNENIEHLGLRIISQPTL